MAATVAELLLFSTELDYDANGNLIYMGMSIPGQATSASTWQIRKFTYDASGNLLSILYANGSRTYTNAWDSRVGYTYT